MIYLHKCLMKWSHFSQKWYRASGSNYWMLGPDSLVFHEFETWRKRYLHINVIFCNVDTEFCQNMEIYKQLQSAKKSVVMNLASSGNFRRSLSFGAPARRPADDRSLRHLTPTAASECGPERVFWKKSFNCSSDNLTILLYVWEPMYK